MLLRSLAAALPALLLPAAAAAAADPIMPLSQVRAGMQCTGLSVIKGTEISSFDVEVLDVVDAEATGGGARILIRVSGPAVEPTGMGPGFSGSPIMCPDGQGAASNIGAVSLSVGEFGNDVALATPIEGILGNPVDAPSERGDRALLARARPLTTPLTVSGLSPALGARLEREAARRGRVVLAAPAGPLATFPVQQLRPGSAFGVSYSSGDLRLSGIGTISYVDGASVWGFGHPFEGLGRRELFLQDAYVFRVVDNPLGVPGASTYKLAATGHDLGTISNDALSAVAGRVGGLPDTVPVRVRARDLDTRRREVVETDVADEASVDQPAGSSALSFVAPLAVNQGAVTAMRGSPARMTGRACVEIRLREVRTAPRFCNRYISDAPDFSGTSNGIGSLVSADLGTALGIVDSFKLGRVHVTGISVRVGMERGQRLAYLRRVRLPAKVRAGSKVRATLTLRHVRGQRERRRVTVRLPRDIEPGRRRLRFVGMGVDSGGGEFFGDLSFLFGESSEDGGEGAGPASVQRVVKRIKAVGRYDGVRVRGGGSDDGEGERRRRRQEEEGESEGGGESGGDDESAEDPAGTKAYRDPQLRIAGRVTVRVQVVAAKSRRERAEG
jgi:hypothetical protein